MVPVGKRQQLERQLKPLLVPTAGHEELGHDVPGRIAQQRPKRKQVDPPRTIGGRTAARRQGGPRGRADEGLVCPRSSASLDGVLRRQWLVGQIRQQPRTRLMQLGFLHDVVPVEHRPGLVSRQLHRDALGHARPH